MSSERLSARIHSFLAPDSPSGRWRRALIWSSVSSMMPRTASYGASVVGAR